MILKHHGNNTIKRFFYHGYSINLEAHFQANQYSDLGDVIDEIKLKIEKETVRKAKSMKERRRKALYRSLEGKELFKDIKV